MINSNKIKNITKNLLRENFFNYFSKTKKETKHIILDRLFPDERRITSTMTGLQTSLGTYWEKLAIAFADENCINIIKNTELSKPKIIPPALNDLIAKVKKEREDNGGQLDELKIELNDLLELNFTPEVEFETMTKGKGADLILEKDGQIYIFDIKTVQINANSGNSFNETLILWTAYYKFKFGVDAKLINAMLVFPYNSGDENNDGAWWDDFNGRVLPLTNKDVFVGNEFWSFLTDNPLALRDIMDGLDELASDEEFIQLYKQVFECENSYDFTMFSENIRLANVEKKFNITLLEHTTPWNLRKKFLWKHTEDCSFEERFNKLLNATKYDCPNCSEPLG